VTSCARGRHRCRGATCAHVVVVARAVVVDALSSSSGFYGVPGVAVGPETTLDRRCRGSDSFPASLLLGRRGIRAVGRWRSSPPALRALARGRAFRLLRYRSLENRLQLLAHSSLLGVAGSGQLRSSMAATVRFWDACRKSGGASASVLAFARPLAR
jgi:hypothetical protein